MRHEGDGDRVDDEAEEGQEPQRDPDPGARAGPRPAALPRSPRRARSKRSRGGRGRARRNHASIQARLFHGCQSVPALRRAPGPLAAACQNGATVVGVNGTSPSPTRPETSSGEAGLVPGAPRSLRGGARGTAPRPVPRGGDRRRARGALQPDAPGRILAAPAAALQLAGVGRGARAGRQCRGADRVPVSDARPRLPVPLSERPPCPREPAPRPPGRVLAPPDGAVQLGRARGAHPQPGRARGRGGDVLRAAPRGAVRPRAGVRGPRRRHRGRLSREVQLRVLRGLSPARRRS